MYRELLRYVRPIDREFGLYLEKQGASELTALGAILVSYALSQGNTCLDIKTVHHTDLWGEHEDVPSLPENRDEWISDLQDSPFTNTSSETPLLTLRGTRLYLSRYFQYESGIVSRLKQNESPKALPEFSAATQQLMKSLFKTSTDFSDFSGDLQLAGSLLPLFFPFTILSGGPGTGKTTTVAKLLALLISNSPETRIALAAPTGKAAQRMNESIQKSIIELKLPVDITEKLQTLEAATLHRLLGVRHLSNQFRHNRETPLDVDLIVVDEASMIDLPLLAKLLQALPDTCSVILLGDQYQLASVEAGSVLGDICSAFPNNSFSPEFTALHSTFATTKNRVESADIFSPVVQFTRSFRFDPFGGVGKVSRLVNSGEITIAAELNDPNGEVILTPSVEQGELLALSKGIRTSPTAETALSRLNEGIILTLRNEGEYGQAGINSTILNHLRKNNAPFVNNMPIMITENSYNMGLFNGDMGVVRKESGDWLACFYDENGSVRRLPVVLLPNWQPAFAITIHKSQGSEYKRLIVLLGTGETPLLTRELIYTAITRAKPEKGAEAGSVILQGTPELLAKGISSRTERSSGLRDEILTTL